MTKLEILQAIINLYGTYIDQMVITDEDKKEFDRLDLAYMKAKK